MNQLHLIDGLNTDTYIFIISIINKTRNEELEKGYPKSNKSNLLQTKFSFYSNRMIIF